MLALTLDGQGFLVKPVPIKPGDSDEWKRRLEALDLGAVYRDTMARIKEVLTADGTHNSCPGCWDMQENENNFCTNCGRRLKKAAKSITG
jgi:hypothetical protein